MTALTPAQIRSALAGLEHWRRRGRVIHRDFAFPDFSAALAFVNAVASAAEEACHHPDIDIRWNQVRLSLTTHDAGGLTDSDFVMAARFDALAGGRRARQRPAVRRAARSR